MKIADFKLEVFFNEHEFSAPYLLCCSDCETMSIEELLAFEPGAKEDFLACPLGYSETRGDPELLYEISTTYKTVNEDGVLEFVGAQEAIFVFMNVALKKGDHMITMFPAYQSIYEICNALGCEVSRWNLIRQEKGWAVDIDDLAGLIRPNTKVIAVNSPNNPTGFTLSDEQIKQIADLAAKHGVMVLSDEVYSGLELPSDRAVPFADVYDNAFSLNVLSKAYGLPGLRIGWLATRNKAILSKMQNFKHYTTICSPIPSQRLSIIAVKHREGIFARNRRIISDNLQLSDIFFEKHGGFFTYNRPMAGPIAFHRLNSGRTAREFCEELRKKEGVLLAHGELFDFDGSFFRMGYGRKSFKTALELLDKFVTAMR